MDSTEYGPMKPRITALLEQGVAEQQAFIEQLSDEARAANGEFEAWSAKDHVAHNVAWKADAVLEIEAALRGEEYSPDSTTVFNPRVFAEQQNQSWEVVLADAEQADTALRAVLEKCSEADLTDPSRFPWRDGLLLWTFLVSGYEHPAEHYGQFYVEAGDVARASKIREAMIETASRYVGDTRAIGYMTYNLGCFYANTGQPDLSIAALRRAIGIVPDLRDGVRDDSELAPLNDNPEFQAFVAELGEPASA